MTVSSTLFLINLHVRSNCHSCDYEQGRVGEKDERSQLKLNAGDSGWEESRYLEGIMGGSGTRWHWTWVRFWLVVLEAGFPGGGAMSQIKCPWVDSGSSDWSIQVVSVLEWYQWLNWKSEMLTTGTPRAEGRGSLCELSVLPAQFSYQLKPALKKDKVY